MRPFGILSHGHFKTRFLFYDSLFICHRQIIFHRHADASHGIGTSGVNVQRCNTCSESFFESRIKGFDPIKCPHLCGDGFRPFIGVVVTGLIGFFPMYSDMAMFFHHTRIQMHPGGVYGLVGLSVDFMGTIQDLSVVYEQISCKFFGSYRMYDGISYQHTHSASPPTLTPAIYVSVILVLTSKMSPSATAKSANLPTSKLPISPSNPRTFAGLRVNMSMTSFLSNLSLSISHIWMTPKFRGITGASVIMESSKPSSFSIRTDLKVRSIVWNDFPAAFNGPSMTRTSFKDVA